MRCAGSASSSASTSPCSGSGRRGPGGHRAHPRPSPPGLRDRSIRCSQELYPWVMKQMLAGRAVVLHSLDDAARGRRDRPRERPLDRHQVEPDPSARGGGEPPVGALAFNALRAERDWPDALVKRLAAGRRRSSPTRSARRRHELSLRESEERLALAADSAEAAAVDAWLPHGRLLGHRQARAIFGYRARTSSSRSTLSRTSVAPRRPGASSARPSSRSARRDEPYAMEYRLPPQRPPLVRWIDLPRSPQPDAAGEPRRLMGVSMTSPSGSAPRRRSGRARPAWRRRADLAGLAFYEVDFARRHRLRRRPLPRPLRRSARAAATASGRSSSGSSTCTRTTASASWTSASSCTTGRWSG